MSVELSRRAGAGIHSLNVARCKHDLSGSVDRNGTTRCSTCDAFDDGARRMSRRSRMECGSIVSRRLLLVLAVDGKGNGTRMLVDVDRWSIRRTLVARILCAEVANGDKMGIVLGGIAT